ncbi:MAG: SIR2 family protein [Anaerolineae bacterium]
MPLTDKAWDNLIQNIIDGDVIPVLGAGACYGHIKLGSQITSDWLTDGPDYLGDDLARQLPYVAQYHRVIEGDAVNIKKDFLRRYIETPIHVPDYKSQTEPHGRLASMPFELVITTNYDDMMNNAFKAFSKNPETLICTWNTDKQAAKIAEIERQGKITPSKDRPVIFHLHGHNSNPRSLVLLEEDYEQFLASLAKPSNGLSDDESILPSYVQDGLANRPLLFIGYSIADMTFRSVFRGLLNSVNSINQRRHVTVQYTNGLTAKRDNYMAKYYDSMNITFVNQQADDFTKELLEKYRKAVGHAP